MAGRSGFRLLQMAVVIAAFGILLGAVLPGRDPRDAAKPELVTADHLERIDTAAARFMAANCRRPCPADATLATIDPAFGAERNCRGTPPEANLGPAGNVVAGAVPTRALGLPAEAALDGYGRKLTKDRPTATFDDAVYYHPGTARQCRSGPLCTASADLADCFFSGRVVPNGHSIPAYSTDNPPPGTPCSDVAETRACSGGTLSGSYPYGSRHPSCSPSAAQGGGTLAHGGTRPTYAVDTVQGPASCPAPNTLTCTDGTLSCSTGTMADCGYGSCAVDPSCPVPWGRMAGGSSVTTYSAVATT